MKATRVVLWFILFSVQRKSTTATRQAGCISHTYSGYRYHLKLTPVITVERSCVNGRLRTRTIYKSVSMGDGS